MGRAKNLPDGLHPQVFSTTEASRLGVARSRLRAADLESPTRGLRTRAGIEPDPLAVFRAYTRLDAGTCLSHHSAAACWGLWLPRFMQRSLPIHVTRTKGRGGRSTRPGVVGHVAPMPDQDRRLVHGLLLTSPARTWADLAGTGISLAQLVTAGDALLQRADGPPRPAGLLGTNPLATVEEVREVIDRRRSVPGVRLARQALDLLRPGVDSAPESHLRQLITAAGFPEPAVNPRVGMGNGRNVRPDLAWEELRIAVQYEGEHHLLDPAQWARDIERDDAMRARGWMVIRVTKDIYGFGGRERFLLKLTAAFQARGARRPPPAFR